MELADLAESVELGFVSSTFFYLPLVQFYFNQHYYMYKGDEKLHLLPLMVPS